MKKFWELVLKARDFSHQLSVRQYGEEGSGSEYKFKFMVFISGYGLTIIFLILQLLFYFFGTQILFLSSEDPWYLKLMYATCIIFLPIYIIARYLLGKIDNIPLSLKYSRQKYRHYSIIYWSGFLFGYLLWIGVGILAMSYLREFILP